MTLIRNILAASIVFSTLAASAYIVPGPPRGGPGRGNPSPYPNPYPSDPYPSDPYPGNPGYPPIESDNGVSDQKTIYLGRQVVNETLGLRQLLGIGAQYDGSVVESVSIEVMGGGSYSSQIDLVVNGNSVDRAYSPSGLIGLFPSQGSVLGRDISTLRLRVSGAVYINSITVHLRGGGSGGGNGGGGHGGGHYRDVVLPLNIYQQVYGSARIDLGRYVNLASYQGMRILSIEVEAQANYGAALIDVLINGFSQGALNVSPYQQVHIVSPRGNSIIGRGADSIVIFAQGNQLISRVTLRLAR